MKAHPLKLFGQPLRRGDRVRVWYGSDFIRSGVVRGIDEYDQLVLVKFDYDIPDEWVAFDKLC